MYSLQAVKGRERSFFGGTPEESLPDLDPANRDKMERAISPYLGLSLGCFCHYLPFEPADLALIESSQAFLSELYGSYEDVSDEMMRNSLEGAWKKLGR